MGIKEVYVSNTLGAILDCFKHRIAALQIFLRTTVFLLGAKMNSKKVALIELIIFTWRPLSLHTVWDIAHLWPLNLRCMCTTLHVPYSSVANMIACCEDLLAGYQSSSRKQLFCEESARQMLVLRTYLSWKLLAKDIVLHFLSFLRQCQHFWQSFSPKYKSFLLVWGPVFSFIQHSNQPLICKCRDTTMTVTQCSNDRLRVQSHPGSIVWIFGKVSQRPSQHG